MKIEQTLRSARDDGRKSLVIYLTAGVGPWKQALHEAAMAGADVVEIGIPFSDPVMDGPVIQQACEQALEAGTTPESVLADIAVLDAPCPLAVMTYYNLVFRFGLERFAARCAAVGVSGAILPDLPLIESASWCEAADASDIETILLAATTSSDQRLSEIAQRCRGFVYGVGLLGVTGERDQLASSATEIARRLKAVTDIPVLVGVGVSTPEQAVEACTIADGVVVGSAVVRKLLDTGSAQAVGELVGQFRQALDS